MKHRTARLLAPALGISLLFIGACSIVSPQRHTAPPASTENLTVSEQIAGEIMAYLIEVVLGRAGALEKRQAWATRGIGLLLDFDLVSRRMFGPVPLRAELMVLDTNILGLSRVLYHYDRRLNLFKGTREHDSLYPCSELMAIRLLLLKKLQQKQKVNLSALSHHAALFEPGSRDAIGVELAAMQLSSSEFRFLKAIFQSEPAFLSYMHHPFIISTLRRIGVAEPDVLTLSSDLAATYNDLACNPGEKKTSRPITIAILPAMNAMFEADSGQIMPSVDYENLQEQLRIAIASKLSLVQGLPAAGNRLEYYSPGRPVTVHPGNADRVIGQLCPTADFSVILLGKNVYRALFIDPRVDTYPHKNRIYLDVDDVRYQQIDTEIENIVKAISPALSPGTPSLPAT